MDKKTTSSGLQIAIRLAMEALGYGNITDPNHEQVAEVNAVAKKILSGDADTALLDA